MSTTRTNAETMLRTRKLCWALIGAVVEPLGYVVSGNHVFRAADLAAIERGCHRYAVAERPGAHPARVVRAAELLQRTYR